MILRATLVKIFLEINTRERTITSYLQEIINPQDQLLLALLYDGIRGKQLSEIINLHINQIEGNILHLHSGRDLEVDNRLIHLIHETNDTYIYYSYGETPKKWELFGDNVFKVTKGVRSNSITSIYHRFTAKMVNFQKYFDNYEITINRIVISGMLNAIIKEANKYDIPIREFVTSVRARPILDRYQFNRHPTKVLGLFEEYLDYLY